MKGIRNHEIQSYVDFSHFCVLRIISYFKISVFSLYYENPYSFDFLPMPLWFQHS